MYVSAARDFAVRAPARIREIRLSVPETIEATRLALECEARYSDPDSPDFLAESAVVAHELPLRVRHEIEQARLDDRLHALVLRGNAVDQTALGPTPEHWRTARTEGSRRYSFLFVLYASLLGDAVGWATQQDGRVVTDVLPVRGQEQSLTSASSSMELGLHTEDAFSPYRADYVGLFSLRNPDAVATTIAGLEVERLNPELVDVLFDDRFYIRPDDSHLPKNNSTDRDGHGYYFTEIMAAIERPRPVPILRGHYAAPQLRIDTDFSVPMLGDSAAGAALDAIIAELGRSLYEITLGAGDIGFLDNRNVVHGRRSFQPRHDGTDRWLKRLNVTSDLRKSRAVRRTANARVLGES